ncbi:MAG: glycosyltransferase family 39 protein [Proteobacteria bacterium]|nr:glycosyltransferase family 39 protein [Pseudomonadota bacterium]
MSPGRRRLVPWLVLAGVLGVAAVSRAQFLSIPFERDEGIYAYFARLILEGETPFLGFYEVKPPGLYYAYAGIAWIFGDTVEGIRTGFLLVNLATLVLVFAVGRRLRDEQTGLVAAASLMVLSLAPMASGFASQAEHLVVLFALAGLLLMLSGLDRGSLARLFGAGLALGASVLIKQNGAFFAAALGAGLGIALWPRRTGDARRLGRAVGAFSAGVVLPLAGSVLVMWRQGALGAFWFWTVEVSGAYVSEVGLTSGLRFLVGQLRRVAQHDEIFWVLGLAGLAAFWVGAGRVGASRRTAKIVLACFAAASFAATAPGLRFYSHYWLLVMPALALGVGVAFSSAGAWLSSRTGREVWRLAAGGVFATLWLLHLAIRAPYYFQPDFEAVLRQVYGFNPFLEAKVIGDHLREHTSAGDTIVVIGSEPEVYFYAGRRCPSRHAYFEYLVFGHPDHRLWQREFIEDVERARPRFVTLFRNRVSLVRAPSADRAIFDWARRFLSDHYQLVGAAVTTPDYRTEYLWGRDRLEDFRAPKNAAVAFVYEWDDGSSSGR